jgi:hypothetical protein
LQAEDRWTISRLELRLYSAFRRYATGLDQRRFDGIQLAKQFRKDMDLLIARFGQAAIDAALDELPIGGARPSGGLH